MVRREEKEEIFKNQKQTLPGDSVQNIIGDIFSVGLGYILGTVFLAVELWWLSIVWILVSEVDTLYSKKYRLVTCV